MSKISVVFPGSFDPITHGHTDLIRRAAAIFDHVIVAVTTNTSKNALLTVDERVELASAVLGVYDNVEVCAFSGLLVDFVAKNHATLVLRGLRNSVDLSWELPLATMNRSMNGAVETVFMTPSSEFSAISATLVREIAMNQGDFSAFVDERVVKKLQAVISKSIENGANDYR